MKAKNNADERVLSCGALGELQRLLPCVPIQPRLSWVSEPILPSVRIHPAATVIVLRDGSLGLEVLVLQRAGELAFHGGHWVFPGGRVDPADVPPGDAQDRDSLRAALRAAVRETREEAGLILEPEALVPFSHWTTPQGPPRRFATWFFAAVYSADREVVVDGGEIRAHRWLTPQEALAQHHARSIELPPPTFVTLSVLANQRSAGDVLERARKVVPPVFLPRPRPIAQGVISLYPGDAAYEGEPLECAGPRHRLCMLQSGWEYLCTP